MKNGVPAHANNDDLIRVCKMFESFGEELKLSEINIPNLIIVDREKVFLNIAGKKSRTDQTDLIIYNSAIANNMLDLFNYYWEQSYTIGNIKMESEFKTIVKPTEIIVLFILFLILIYSLF